VGRRESSLAKVGVAMFDNIYKGKTVVVTGHAGVKGSWLSLWLKHLGAKVIGIGHPPKSGESHYKTLPQFTFYRDIKADLLFIMREIYSAKPDIVFHLAAKAIVARTFKEPEETFRNNVMGTAHLLELCRTCPSVKGVVAITSDKVYKSREWNYAYRENDTLGGDDPYSTSKVCVEHIIECYRKSYGMNIATARAGNVLCGGDWAEKRLLPDVVRATIKKEPVIIHTPNATRPFQHVLEALQGYLLLGQKILQGEDVNRAWNFGPTEGEMTVLAVLERASLIWPDIRWEVDSEPTHKFMVYLLKLDSTESRKLLGWKQVWDTRRAVMEVVRWYRTYHRHKNVLSLENIKLYERGMENV